MLQLAVQAGIPIIAVKTTDVLNVAMVLEHVTKLKPNKLKPEAIDGQLKAKALHYLMLGASKKLPDDLSGLYNKLVDIESTLIVVNSPAKNDLFYDAGLMPVPADLMFKTLQDVFGDESTVAGLMPTLGGVTLKDASEFIRLTMARDKSCTPEGVMVTRKSSFQGNRGITLVDTSNLAYDPPPFLIKWVQAEKDFFLASGDSRLVPRGLLFGGLPGTGKSAGAKWVAAQLGIPLYRVDIGSMKQKYVGESEDNMLNALGQLDQEEPCVALFDEVEKIFSIQSGVNDGNTTSSMLSQLLWWLAEHRSRVLTIMTCNNQNVIPRELYRDRRIDDVVEFQGFDSSKKALPFASYVLGTYGFKPDMFVGGEKRVMDALQEAFAHKGVTKGDKATQLAHAAVEQAMITLIKTAPKVEVPVGLAPQEPPA